MTSSKQTTLKIGNVLSNGEALSIRLAKEPSDSHSTLWLG
jgi:hypothetical protein